MMRDLLANLAARRLATGLIGLGLLLGFFVGFSLTASSGPRGAAAVLTGLAVVLFVASAAMGAAAYVPALREKRALAARRSRIGLMLLLAACVVTAVVLLIR